MQPLRKFQPLNQFLTRLSSQSHWLAALLLALLLAACAPVQPVVAPADQPVTTATEEATEEASADPAAESSAFPVTIENCGLETTYTEAPIRGVTMNQAATEIMLKLGLEGSMVGT